MMMACSNVPLIMGMKLDVTLLNPASPFRPKRLGPGGCQLSNDRNRVIRFFSSCSPILAQFSRENYLACALLITTCVQEKWSCWLRHGAKLIGELKVWHLPKSAQKAQVYRHSHSVRPAMSWLKELKIRSCGGEWVFPGQEDQQA